ncbi:hypothetical protein EVAR_99844_1 [Eumeta japonica]|uniref:Uncharacterized protein n=1 Tax=Eumeta variegata TaxID=151549 RepID=A0A4C1SU54_EUMVA|nr:hypothetical protein EVAR_99844_1 [Eumeta japonica]
MKIVEESFASETKITNRLPVLAIVVAVAGGGVDVGGGVAARPAPPPAASSATHRPHRTSPRGRPSTRRPAASEATAVTPDFMHLEPSESNAISVRSKLLRRSSTTPNTRRRRPLVASALTAETAAAARRRRPPAPRAHCRARPAHAPLPRPIAPWRGPSVRRAEVYEKAYVQAAADRWFRG